jgi:hypothetical protein
MLRAASEQRDRAVCMQAQAEEAREGAQKQLDDALRKLADAESMLQQHRREHEQPLQPYAYAAGRPPSRDGSQRPLSRDGSTNVQRPQSRRSGAVPPNVGALQQTQILEVDTGTPLDSPIQMPPYPATPSVAHFLTNDDQATFRSRPTTADTDASGQSYALGNRVGSGAAAAEGDGGAAVDSDVARENRQLRAILSDMRAEMERLQHLSKSDSHVELLEREKKALQDKLLQSEAHIKRLTGEREQLISQNNTLRAELRRAKEVLQQLQQQNVHDEASMHDTGAREAEASGRAGLGKAARGGHGGVPQIGGDAGGGRGRIHKIEETMQQLVTRNVRMRSQLEEEMAMFGNAPHVAFMKENRHVPTDERNRPVYVDDRNRPVYLDDIDRAAYMQDEHGYVYAHHAHYDHDLAYADAAARPARRAGAGHKHKNGVPNMTANAFADIGIQGVGLPHYDALGDYYDEPLASYGAQGIGSSKARPDMADPSTRIRRRLQEVRESLSLAGRNTEVKERPKVVGNTLRQTESQSKALTRVAISASKKKAVKNYAWEAAGAGANRSEDDER